MCVIFLKLKGDRLMSQFSLKKSGLKSTLPRIQILELLENNHENNENNKHLSAEDVYKMLIEQDKEIGLATVYRVLTQFEKAGILNRHHFDGLHSIFELNEGEHHDHLVCIKCGNVDEFFDEEIENSQHRIAEKFDFEITDHSLYIYGVCKNCA